MRVHESHSPTRRYVADARALCKDSGLPEATRREILPGVLRQALEAACYDRYYTERLQAGATLSKVEADVVGGDDHQATRATAPRDAAVGQLALTSPRTWTSLGDLQQRAARITPRGHRRGDQRRRAHHPRYRERGRMTALPRRRNHPPPVARRGPSGRSRTDSAGAFCAGRLLGRTPWPGGDGAAAAAAP